MKNFQLISISFAILNFCLAEVIPLQIKFNGETAKVGHGKVVEALKIGGAAPGSAGSRTDPKGNSKRALAPGKEGDDLKGEGPSNGAHGQSPVASEIEVNRDDDDDVAVDELLVGGAEIQSDIERVLHSGPATASKSGKGKDEKVIKRRNKSHKDAPPMPYNAPRSPFGKRETVKKQKRAIEPIESTRLDAAAAASSDDKFRGVVARANPKFPTAFCELELDNGIICPGLRRGLHIEQFYYNADTNRCSHFVYNGCGGNANRFSSLWECSQSCVRQYTESK